ncbi:uncharacterized protein LOC106669764 isoform X2 [Cimex lectularius]|uniref:Uncharacterized protein n=1 Tax=Cimex lectularius TaxID=79782 RepID=A0A8I6TMB1_CIMLE|nr:uncharacterized protein LOC106669764 isoform X2 [Cimex lectularius]
MDLRKIFTNKNVPRGWTLLPHPDDEGDLSRSVSSLVKKLDDYDYEFEYVLRPLIRPSLAFGSKIPRDPTERVIKKHRLKIKRKQGRSKSITEKKESYVLPGPPPAEVKYPFIDLSPKFHLPDYREETKDVEKAFSIITGDEESTVAKDHRHKKTSKLHSYDRLTKKRVLYQTESPSPGSYNINRFPDPVKPNKFGFNSGSYKFPASSNDVPSAAAYYIDCFDGKVKMHCTLGGKQTISLATMIRCLPENRNLCKYCQTEPEGNFMYSQTHGTVCRECFKEHAKSYPAHVFSTFQAAKHCKFMHFHDQHTTVRKVRYKEVIKSVRREACINRFPEMKKNVKKDKDDQKEKISDAKPKPFKRVVKIQKRIKPNKPREILRVIDTTKHKSEQRMSEEQIEQQRQSAEREYEMLAKEYAYQQMKGRHSIIPIFNLLNKEEKLFPILTQDNTRDKSDFQKRLIERFGSSASFYGTLIPEFREKGVVHAVDPESDQYVITAKGRDFYNKTPLAWDLADDPLLDDELLRVTGKNVFDELEDKMQNMCRAKDIVVPPLPRSRLSGIIIEDSAKPLKPQYSRSQLEKPIISREYDIPKSYWYNIDR